MRWPTAPTPGRSAALPPGAARWLGVIAAVGSLAGCQPPAPGANPVNAGFQVSQQPTQLLDPATGEAPQTLPALYAVRTLLLPLIRPMDAAWAHIDETVLPPLSRAVWNANGLRLGVLSAADAEAFGGALGPIAARSDGQFVNGQHLDPLRESPRIAATFTADLSLPPGPPRLQRMDQGRLRLLVSSRPLGNGRVQVELIPQNHIPRATLQARSPFEKMLDGRVFDELGVSLQLGPDQALVLGYFPPPDATPPPPAPEGDPTAASDPGRAAAPSPQDTRGTLPTPEGGTPPAEGDGEPPPPPGPTLAPDQVFDEAQNRHLPLNLGRGLFTLGRTHDDMQVLMLLRPLRR